MVKFKHLNTMSRVVCAALLVGSLAACNTLGGAGRDVSAVGNSVTTGVGTATGTR